MTKRETKKGKMLVLALVFALTFILTAGLASACLEEACCNMILTKSVDKTDVQPGDIVTITLKYKNIGNAICTGGGVKIQDTLTSNLDYMGSFTKNILNDVDGQGIDYSWYEIPGYDETTNTLTWNAHVVSPGEEGTIKFEVRVLEREECGDFEIPNFFKAWSVQKDWQYSNTITILVDDDCYCPECGNGILDEDEECDDGNLVNGDGCSSACKLEEGCNIELVKSTNKNNVKPGDIVTFTLHYKNTGDRICTGGGVKIQDTLNSNLNYSGTFTKNIINDIDGQGLDSAWYEIPGYDPITKTLTWNAHVVSPGEEGNITFNVKVLTPAQCGDFQIPNYFRAWSNEENWKNSNTVNLLVDNYCPSCGDGNLDAGEECDDGNLVNGDGCSSTCQTECLPYCGDGILDNGEECDDGNTANGDGCSANCETEFPPCEYNISIRYSYGNSFGTGIAINNSETYNWVTETPAHLNQGIHKIRYYVDNHEAEDNNASITVKLDGGNILPYYQNINIAHYKTLSLDTSNLECDSLHTISVEVESESNGICTDDDTSDNYAEREIYIDCEEDHYCGDGSLDSGEECDLGINNGEMCTPAYGGICSYCSSKCEEILLTDGYCGDGILQPAYEECDDGNSNNLDTCRNDCTIQICPPGVICGKITTEEFPPIVWQCGDRVLTDENIQPWRFSGESEELFERAGNYLFEGERYQINVVVFDKNKIQDVVVDLILGTGDEQTADEADFNINCVPTTQVNFVLCNARIDEEVITKFEPDTMQAYTCTITALDSEHMYGDYWLTVLADDGDASGVYDEMTPIFINPMIMIGINGELDFSDVRPGTSSYSRISLTNNAEGGVALDMFITGKDWPAADSNLGRCQNLNGQGAEIAGLVNYLPLGAFRYYAENGAFSTRDDEEKETNYDPSVLRECDAEGYCTINKQLNAGFEEAMFEDAEIIQAGGPVVEQGASEYGYRANVLNPGAKMALTFRLNLPEPCYGEFESESDGSIFLWAEAI